MGRGLSRLLWRIRCVLLYPAYWPGMGLGTWCGRRLIWVMLQPRPYAAIDLIHKQPVRWTKTRSVSCDGGGGPLGHPRIFINVDKPQICQCTYCGLPFVHTTLHTPNSARGSFGS